MLGHEAAAVETNAAGQLLDSLGVATQQFLVVPTPRQASNFNTLSSTRYMPLSQARPPHCCGQLQQAVWYNTSLSQFHSLVLYLQESSLKTYGQTS